MRASRIAGHVDTIVLAHRRGDDVNVLSVRVEMAVRRALESDGGEPVLDIAHIGLSRLAPPDVAGFEAARSSLLQDYAESRRISVAAAAMRLDFTAVVVRYARPHH
jgi:hypothetical protein